MVYWLVGGAIVSMGLGVAVLTFYLSSLLIGPEQNRG